MKKTNTECERKFLVTSDEYKKLASSHYLIKQGYLCKDPLRSVRIRLCQKSAFLTIKSAPDTASLTHFEWEKTISWHEGENLIKLCIPPIIEKTRWIIPINDKLKWEIDEFHGKLSGLTIAEIELEEENQTFPIFPFIGKDVSFNKKYLNVNL